MRRTSTLRSTHTIMRESFRLTSIPWPTSFARGVPPDPGSIASSVPGEFEAQGQKKLRMAIQAHFHYPELIGDFLNKIAANEAHCDLLLSTNDEAKAEVLRAATASFDRGRVEIRVVPNRGRDIGPLLSAYGSDIAQNYDVVGHLHSKRSSGIDAAMGETWREFLWQHLLGSRYPMMDIALAHFARRREARADIRRRASLVRLG